MTGPLGQTGPGLVTDATIWFRLPRGSLPDPIVPLGVAAASVTATCRESSRPLSPPEPEPACRALCAARCSRGNAPRHLDLALRAGQLPLAVKLTVWDFTLPDHLSFLPEMNCYGLPENERAYYRLAHRHRTVLNRLAVQPERPGPGRRRTAAGTGTGSTGRAGIAGSGRSLTARRSPTCRARGCPSSASTFPCTRTGQPPWRGTTTAATGPTRPFRTRIAGHLSRHRGRSPSTC